LCCFEEKKEEEATLLWSDERRARKECEEGGVEETHLKARKGANDQGMNLFITSSVTLATERFLVAKHRQEIKLGTCDDGRNDISSYQG
jgi:hypothetical protein